MTTRTDEIKAEIAQLDRNIEADIILRRARMVRVKLLHDHIRQLRKRRLTLQAQLEREDTVLVKPQPVGVKLDGYDI